MYPSVDMERISCVAVLGALRVRFVDDSEALIPLKHVASSSVLTDALSAATAALGPFTLVAPAGYIMAWLQASTATSLKCLHTVVLEMSLMVRTLCKSSMPDAGLWCMWCEHMFAVLVCVQVR